MCHELIILEFAHKWLTRRACVIAEVREGGDAVGRAAPDAVLAQVPPLAQITANLAKRERLDRMGMATSAAAGRVNGGPRRFGFEPVVDGKLTPRSEEVEVARLMFEMAREGKTQMDIARELNAQGHRRVKGDAWTQPKVGRILGDRIWIGKLVNQAGEHELFEPLIPVELFEAVQRTLCKDGTRRGRYSDRFLLANGLLRCGGCGSSLSIRRAETPAGTREHYRCSGSRSGANDCKQPDVPRHRSTRPCWSTSLRSRSTWRARSTS
jgi:Recombinase/Recombinase zinc beta ribbon domain